MGSILGSPYFGKLPFIMGELLLTCEYKKRMEKKEKKAERQKFKAGPLGSWRSSRVLRSQGKNVVAGFPGSVR